MSTMTPRRPDEQSRTRPTARRKNVLFVGVWRARFELMQYFRSPDTLFFTRRLVLEGDTELGLEIKNALDALAWR